MEKVAVKVLADRWRTVLATLLVVLLAGIILLPKLGSLVPSATFGEQPSQLGITEIESLLEDPFFLPERVVQAALVYTHHANGTYLRLVSVMFAALALALMYWLLSMWYTRRVAVLTLLLFGTSSWFLHQARWAEPDVLYLVAVPIFLIGSILLEKKRHDPLWPLTIFALALLLYLPGLWAYAALFLIFNFGKIRKTFKYMGPVPRVVCAFALILPLVPLVYSFWRGPWLITTWLGIPEKGLSLSSIPQNLYEIPKQLLVAGPNSPLHWLSGTPILDAAAIALIAIGIYSYKSGLYPTRWRVLAGLGLVSIALIGLGGLVSLSLIIPLAYIFAGNGLALLLQQWFTVFPRNPFARSVGITAVIILVLASCSYQLVRYYIAWPHAPATYRAIQYQTP